jgi:hypothetical protein
MTYWHESNAVSRECLMLKSRNRKTDKPQRGLLAAATAILGFRALSTGIKSPQENQSFVSFFRPQKRYPSRRN